MRGIIICGGTVGEYIKNYIKPDDFVICADSGYDHAKKFGIRADIVIGDMDSTKYGDISEEKMLYPKRKDFTDSELAIMYAEKKGFESVLLFGMIGTRMDHSLANIGMISRLKNAVIIDENNETYFAGNEFSLNGKPGDIISIIPFCEDLFGVTTVGLDYPLVAGEIKCGTSLGISNVMTGDNCRIKIEKGKALIIRSKD
ncbi:MAG: thiamine diphosphokinase [Clostridia bacterium]|nr:thiamine diphosphokinase [Clostridia bacterium]